MPFDQAFRHLQWSPMHMLTGDCEPGLGSRLNDACKRGSGGSTVLLSNLLCSLVKLVDFNAVPVGFRVAAGTRMWVMLEWDYATAHWVLWKPGGIMQYLQPDNVVSTLMGHTLGGSWCEGKSFHQSSLAYVQNGGEHYMAYVSVMGDVLCSSIAEHEDFNDEQLMNNGFELGEQDLDWFSAELQAQQDFMSDDMVSLDMGSEFLMLGEDEAKIQDSVAPQDEPVSKNTKVDNPLLSPCSSKKAELFDGERYAESLSMACTPVASHTVGKKPQDFAGCSPIPEHTIQEGTGKTFVPIFSQTLQGGACVAEVAEVAEVVVVKPVCRLQFSETPSVKSRMLLALEDCARLQATMALWKKPHQHVP